MYTLRVFTNSLGDFGNPVGVIVDTEQKISHEKRQKTAKDSGFSEVVFIDDIRSATVSIYTPLHQIAFAGHALVGASYFLRHQYKQHFPEIISMGNVIKTFENEGQVWVTGPINILPKWNFEQLPTPADIDALTKESMSEKLHTLFWSWIDISSGQIRARTFASDWGIPEDEANGSGTMILSAFLYRKITVFHGLGSIIHTQPADKNMAIVGGSVVLT